MSELPIGEIPEGWRVARLGDVCSKIGSGATPRGGSAVYVDVGTAFIRSQNVYDHEFRTDGLVHIDDEASDQLRGVEVREGDVLLNITGDSILRTCQAPASAIPARVSQHVAIIRPQPQLDSLFLQKYLTLGSVKEYMLGHSAGGTRKAITKGHIEGFAVPMPPLGEQRAIAGVLGALDDKIESNRRQVALLEQVSRAELAVALAGPAGEPWEYAWPEVQLGEILDLIETGDRPKGGVGEITSGVPSVGAESIVAPGVFDYSKTKFVPVEYFARMRRGVLQSGDVLLYKDGGTPGNFIPKVSMCQEGFPFEVAALNSHVYRLRVRAPYSQAFLYFWLSSQRLLDEMWLRGTGAAIPSLNSSNVKGLPFPVIPSNVLAPVLPIVDELMSLLHRAAREQRTIEQLRDALLPELLSGRLRVREVEEMVGSV